MYVRYQHCARYTGSIYKNSDCQATMPQGACHVLYPLLRKAATGKRDGAGLMWTICGLTKMLQTKWRLTSRQIFPAWRRKREERQHEGAWGLSAREGQKAHRASTAPIPTSCSFLSCFCGSPCIIKGIRHAIPDCWACRLRRLREWLNVPGPAMGGLKLEPKSPNLHSSLCFFSRPLSSS